MLQAHQSFTLTIDLTRIVTEQISSVGLVLKKGGSGADADEDINDTGIATKFLVDFQRFSACRLVLQKQHLTSQELCSDFKIIVGNSRIYSARTNLLYRSNSNL